MDLKARFKVAYVPWYRPVRLVKKSGPGTFDVVGWVWRQKAYLVNNLSHGWIAFVEDQTDAKLNTCPSCGRPTADHVGQEPPIRNPPPIGGYQPIGSAEPVAAPPKAP